MFWRIASDAVVVLHATWIAVVIGGPVFALRRPWFQVVHVSMILGTIAIMVSPYYCPLTYLENWLRVQYDPGAVYPGGFIVTYLNRLIYVNIQPIWVLWATVGWAALWLAIYLVVSRKRRRSRTPDCPPHPPLSPRGGARG